eukprot:GHVS01059692.1.p4 GENE.GHVS01059692.1~~GHVS01059692.1.p4  ORF type:complete len:103 (+),score=17.42 GHVS01059692.1:130-438(+)
MIQTAQRRNSSRHHIIALRRHRRASSHVAQNWVQEETNRVFAEAPPSTSRVQPHSDSSSPPAMDSDGYCSSMEEEEASCPNGRYRALFMSERSRPRTPDRCS